MTYSLVCCVGIAANASTVVAATMPDVIDEAYGGYSVAPPTPSIVFVCHGFGCKYRAEVDLTANDRAKLTQFLAAGHSSPDAERKAVATAGAWFDRRVGPVAGTENHVARAGAKYMYDVHQFDCIDSSRNTTSLLLVLDQLKLLRYHNKLMCRRRAGSSSTGGRHMPQRSLLRRGLAVNGQLIPGP